MSHRSSIDLVMCSPAWFARWNWSILWKCDSCLNLNRHIFYRQKCLLGSRRSESAVGCLASVTIARLQPFSRLCYVMSYQLQISLLLYWLHPQYNLIKATDLTPVIAKKTRRYWKLGPKCDLVQKWQLCARWTIFGKQLKIPKNFPWTLHGQP